MGGLGTEKLCAVCAPVISGADIEYEIGPGASRLYGHRACYALWAEEAAAATRCELPKDVWLSESLQPTTMQLRFLRRARSRLRLASVGERRHYARLNGGLVIVHVGFSLDTPEILWT